MTEPLFQFSASGVPSFTFGGLSTDASKSTFSFGPEGSSAPPAFSLDSLNTDSKRQDGKAPASATQAASAVAPTDFSKLFSAAATGASSESSVAGFDIGNILGDKDKDKDDKKKGKSKEKDKDKDKKGEKASDSILPSFGVGGFGLGGDSAAAASDKKDAKTDPASSIDPTSRIKNHTVQEIIDMWNKALEVKKWDQALIENGNKIIALQRSVQQAQVSQVTLTRILEAIKINQTDLFTMISHLEKEATDLSKASLRPGSDELKREETYKMAEEVDSQLMQMQDSLAGTVKKLNAASDRSLDHSAPAAAEMEDRLQTAHALLKKSKAGVRSAARDHPMSSGRYDRY